MSFRHVARRVAASVAATSAVGVAVIAFTAPAGAASNSGTVVPNAAVPQGTSYTPGQPFDSGQQVNVVVPALPADPTNPTGPPLFPFGTGIKIVECAAPNGVAPTQTSACDGNTDETTVVTSQDGSFTKNGYFVYALPDSISLQESGGPACGNTSATECILYIGADQGDFTKPHVWSQPFFVNPNQDDAGSNPGDGTPEVPIAIILPLAAMGLLGGTVLIRRRRARTPADRQFHRARRASPSTNRPRPSKTHRKGAITIMRKAKLRSSVVKAAAVGAAAISTALVLGSGVASAAIPSDPPGGATPVAPHFYNGNVEGIRDAGSDTTFFMMQKIGDLYTGAGLYGCTLNTARDRRSTTRPTRPPSRRTSSYFCQSGKNVSTTDSTTTGTVPK